MNVMISNSRSFDRKKLTREAIRESINARKLAGYDLVAPVNIYDLCETHGVTVRFTPINMEGMYDRSPKPRVHISALRPLVRRNVTCAHELGHHVFGHGSTIDEISEQAEIPDRNNPIEFVANQFAYNLMMPILGVRRAFFVRGIDPANASAPEIFRVSSHFSVGYRTLLSHLRFGLRVIRQSRYEELLKATPKSIRADNFGLVTKSPLVVVDQHWGADAVDLETGDYLLISGELDEPVDVADYVEDHEFGTLLRATKQGISRATISSQNRSIFLRVSQRRTIDGVETGYIGLAQYRHLGDDDA